MDIPLLPKQMEFLQSTEEEVGLVSGIGFGKSTAGSLFVINETAKNPGCPGIILATTYSQVVHATLTNLQYWCDKLGIYFNYNASSKFVTINSTKHYVRSAENFSASRGIQGAFLYVDECAFISEDALQMFLGRIRYPGGSLLKRYVSSPNGFNHFYHRLAKEGDNYHPSRKLIKAKTSDNHFLPKGYVESLRRSYSSKLAAQELDAEFISLSGMGCYSDFVRKKHVTKCKHKFTNHPSQQLYVFCDYNIDPFTAVIGFMDREILVIIDEIYLEGGADTRMMAKEIKRKWGHAYPIVGGDGTGNNRRSIINIKQTSYSIFQEEGLTTVPFTNPHVVKRLANVNRLLFHNLIEIDEGCHKTIKDLELVVYAKNSNDIDKTSNKLITHISDSLGYLAFLLNSGEIDYKPTTQYY